MRDTGPSRVNAVVRGIGGVVLGVAICSEVIVGLMAAYIVSWLLAGWPRLVYLAASLLFAVAGPIAIIGYFFITPIKGDPVSSPRRYPWPLAP